MERRLARRAPELVSTFARWAASERPLQHGSFPARFAPRRVRLMLPAGELVVTVLMVVLGEALGLWPLAFGGLAVGAVGLLAGWLLAFTAAPTERVPSSVGVQQRRRSAH
jgi:hypothetical protein